MYYEMWAYKYELLLKKFNLQIHLTQYLCNLSLKVHSIINHLEISISINMF